MATRNMAYDHPAYIAPETFGGAISGSGGALRFAAFTDMIVKSITMKPTTAGTSNDTVTAFKLSGTTTTTQVLATYGSAATGGTNVLGTLTLAQGDAYSIVKGTDATGVIALGLECAVIAGANVTA
jgi:hypothetical protein